MALQDALYSKETGMFTGMFNISDSVVRLIYYVILSDHRQHTRSRLPASTERSFAYRTTAWYITISAVLFVPPIFLVLLPLTLCLRLALIFDVADSRFGWKMTTTQGLKARVFLRNYY
jgi:hypothetical protein